MGRKLITAKGIFATIGTVILSVLAFVGAIFGIMAAMGKFKTPVVHPTVLEFSNNESVVIAGATYGDPLIKADVNYFTLIGTNEKAKHEVNKKNCYIWFERGAELITLCDENGKPLEKDLNNRYKVKCNEPIYYMVNRVDDEYETDGKVVIAARSENNKVKPNTNFTMYIDRKVETVYLSYGDVPVSGNEQNVYVGVDVPFEFNYVVNPKYAQYPIVDSKFSEKAIELYYDTTETDYIPVNETTVQNAPLNEILTYDSTTNKFTFKSSVVGVHKFKIATFATYEDIDNYNALEKQASATKNYDKVTNYMISTNLIVNVQNVNINRVQFMSSDVVLNLYSENDYITLDGTSGVVGAKNNNLELVMTREDGLTLDSARFDEIKMQGIEFNESIVPNFVNPVSNEKLADLTIECRLALTKISLGNKGTIINHIVLGEDKYYCNNGVAVWQDVNEDEAVDVTEIKLVPYGVYLDFYVKDLSNNFTLVDLNYNATAINSGKTRSWKIVAKELVELQPGQSLQLGLFVVNSEGIFNANEMFDNIPVSLNEVALNYQINKLEENLNITFNEQGEEVYVEQDFSHFVTINEGSYNATILVVESSENLIVDTVKCGDPATDLSLTYNNKTYSVVGYMDGENFVNTVRVNANVKKANKQAQLYMLQFKNTYGQTAADIIEGLIRESLAIENIAIKNVFAEPITISSKYILNPELLKCSYNQIPQAELSNGICSVYENTNNNIIEITLKDGLAGTTMIDKINEYYGMDLDSGFINTNFDNVEAEIAFVEANKITVSFDAKYNLNAENTPIYITLIGIGGEITLGPINVLSGAPDNIVFNAKEIQMETDQNDSQIILSSSVEAAKESEKYIKVKISYNDGYQYEYYYVNGLNETKLDTLFNNNIESPIALGFQGAEDKKQTHEINYVSAENNIFDVVTTVQEIVGQDVKTTSLKVYKTGKTAMSVTIDGTTKYIGLFIDGSAFKLMKDGDDITNSTSSISSENPTSLASVFKLKYNETEEVPLNIDNYTFINDLRIISYGDGIPTVEKQDNGSWVVKSENVEILIIDATDDYKFDYKTPYIPLNIKLNVKTLAGDKEININFTSLVTVSVNANWTDNRVFYTDTKVLLYSDETDTVPVFDINNDNKTVAFKINSIDEAYEFEVKDKHIGYLTIEVYVDGIKIQTFTDFEVKPNVISTSATQLTSDTSFVLKNVYSLQMYKTTEVYGLTENNLYMPNNLEPITDEDKLSLEINEKENNNDLTLSLNNNNQILMVSHMLPVNQTISRTITLKYTADNGRVYQINKADVEIVNKITVSKETIGNIELSVLTPYNIVNFITIDGYFLKSVEIECGEVVVVDVTCDDSGKFTITTITENDYDNVKLTFTFTNSTNNLVYKTEFNTSVNFKLLRYQPEVKSQTIAYSETKYDLLNDIYDIALFKADVVDGVSINSLIVTNIYDENGNSIADKLLASGNLNTGYDKQASNPNCEIIFGKIVGASKIVNVEYTISFSNGVSYVYSVPLIITNRQKIDTPQYPESDLTAGGTFKFINGFEEEAKELSGAIETAADGIYVLTNKNYEPILINSNNIVTLNLKETDVNKFVNRITITNENTQNLLSTANTTTNATIELIAYETRVGMASYINNVTPAYDDNTICFGVAQSGLNGMIVFKVSTISGNYTYYIVKVVSNSTVSTSSHVDVTIESDKTYENVINSLLSGGKIFENVYDADTELYLYNGVKLGSSYDIGNLWTKLDKTTIINLTEYFTTETIGLYYNNGTVEYVYGTITLYIQPSTSITTKTVENVTNLSSAKPNGVYTATVAASATEINCPFDGDWSASVASDIATVDDSKIKLNNRVTEDTTIVVTYTRSDSTVVKVTYTYLATTVPSNKTVTIGQFNPTDGFKNTITLDDDYLGNYESTITIGDTSDKVSYNSGSNVLTFTQTTKTEEYTVTIIYDNLKDEQGKVVSKTFTFIVLPGVHIDATSTNANSGLTSTNRKMTEAATDYTNNTGSKLTFSYTPAGSKTYYTYSIGGLIIYTTDESYLELTVEAEDEKYITNLASNKVTIDADDETIDFVHLATTKDININVAVFNSADEKYVDRTFYATIVKTYNGLSIKYLTVGATHENVVAGSGTTDVVNLHTTLFNGTRIKLIDTNGNENDDANLTNMGFANVGNPNYIEFSCNNNGTIKTTYDANGEITSVGIKFNSVSSNVDCEVFLTNIAGVSAKYTYQIMASGNVDGLNYQLKDADKNRGGIYKDTYLSFVVNESKINAPLVIGYMLDANNDKVFTLSDYITGPVIITNGEAAGTIVGKYTNAIQYQVANGVYITADFDNDVIEMIVTTAGDYNFKISAFGVNGNIPMIDDLTIVIKNYDVTIVDAEETLYAGFIVNMPKKITVKQGKTAVSGITYDLVAAESEYTANGTTYSNINTLVTLEDNNLTIKSIGYDFVTAKLVFEIQKGGYIINKITYDVRINKNMNFVVNGDPVASNLKNNNPSTNFVLNIAESKTNNFPLTYDFVAGSTLVEGNQQTSGNTTYYNVLAVDLYHPYAKDSKGKLVIQESLMGRKNISISLKSLHDDIEIKYDSTNNKYQITFKKDFTGDIEIILTANASVGTYSVVWNVHVTGLIHQEYIDPAKPDYILITNNDLPYNSGAEANILGTDITDNAGVLAKTPVVFNSIINSVKLNYEYKIVENNEVTEVLTNKELFDGKKVEGETISSDYYKGENSGDLTFTSTSLKQHITLPSVPPTDELTRQSYFVVYKFHLEYLGLDKAEEIQVFYITYEVINYQTVNAYTKEDKSSSANVNVASLKDSFLDLFYYKETLTHKGTTYTLTYTDGKVKFNGTETEVTNTTADDVTISVGSAGATSTNYKYTKSTRLLSKQNATDPSKYDNLGTMEITPNYGEKSVFSSNFTNIFEYKAFIEKYLNKENCVVLDDGDKHEFKLIEKEESSVKTGRYGINLKEDLTGSNVLFSNEMKATLTLVHDGVAAVKINAYSAQNTSGFRLYTDEAITANTIKDGEEGIALSDMFLTTYFGDDVDYMSERIIGVGTPDETWVTTTGSDISCEVVKDSGKDKIFATISIPNGTDAKGKTTYNVYNLKQVTYTAIPTADGLYDLKKSYYFLDGADLIVPDYIAVGVETTYFKVPYVVVEGNVKLDLTNAFKVWSMKTVDSKAQLTSDPAYEFVYSETTDDKLSYDGTNKCLTIDISDLDKHKVENPEATDYPMITAIIKVNNSVTLKVNIEFSLN